MQFITAINFEKFNYDCRKIIGVARQHSQKLNEIDSSGNFIPVDVKHLILSLMDADTQFAELIKSLFGNISHEGRVWEIVWVETRN